ncbi:uncharacterized protein [Euwallacea fornicatus]|uniref:uncharacterized protein isoform X2 n=1 Tax=Euwallacea fornicatus TaxID=995702 RepID=UPI00338D8580
MRLMRASWLLLLALSVRAQDNGWTWKQETPDVHQGSPIADLQASASETNPQQNATDVEKVVDEILVSQRQGRALQGYDEVYSDPNVQEALQKGDDGEARNIIKDRLCYLGLMQCEEEIEGKRPYIGPEELIYAQPVAINPVGRPIPTIPVKGVRGGYGPAKPISSIPPGKFIPPPSQHHGKYPSFAHNKPPRRGYGSSFGSNTLSSKPPYFAGGPVNKPPPPFGLAGGEILAEGEFLDKPPSIDFLNHYNKPTVDAPYQFESVGPTAHHNGKDKRVEITVNAQGGLASATAASANKVEHVHHHFHHNADGTAHQSTPVVAAAAVSTLEQGLSTNGFIPVGTGSLPLTSVSGLNTASYGGQTVANYQTFSNKPGSENFGPQTFGSSFGSASPTGLGSFGSSSSNFALTNNNNFGGYYGSNNGLYKKELNVDVINGNYLGSSYADKYQGVESARAESYDCVCVPYDQCPTHEVIGRKDDLFLAIDPRNLKSDIQADGEGKEETRVITDGNGTMTVVRVPKDTASLYNLTSVEEEEVKEGRKISKREAPVEEKETTEDSGDHTIQGRQAYYQPGRSQTCGPRHVCCKRGPRPQTSIPAVNRNTCGTRHSQGINGRIKNPVYVDGDSEFGEYPWQVAILKKDPKESVYVCGGTLIDPLHIITAAHCVKQYTNYDLRVRLGEWDVNHDVEFYPYIERDIATLTVHPEFYAGTLANDIAILRMNTPVDWTKHPHISPACLPHPQDDYTGARCWTTGWGKDAFGDFGKYQNILKEVDVPVVSFGQCQGQLQNTRLGYEFKLHPGFICAGGEEGKDACKGDGGGPMVCERGGTWQLVGVVSWGIGCGQVGVPGVYVRVAHYLDWIRQVTQRY